MRKIYLLLCVGVVAALAVCITLGLQRHKNGPPTFWSFTRHRSGGYYGLIAKSCDQVLGALAAHLTNEIVLDGSDPRLPQPLRDLQATTITIQKNRVWIVVDTRAAYGIVWRQSETNERLWRLTVHGGSEPIIVYQKTRK